MRWLAFLSVESDLQTFEMYSDELRRIQATPREWCFMDQKVKDMKLKIARKAREMGA